MIKHISCDSIWKFDIGNVVQIKIGMVISVTVSVKNIMHVKKICMESQNMYLWEFYLKNIFDDSIYVHDENKNVSNAISTNPLDSVITCDKIINPENDVSLNSDNRNIRYIMSCCILRIFLLVFILLFMICSCCCYYLFLLHKA